VVLDEYTQPIQKSHRRVLLAHYNAPVKNLLPKGCRKRGGLGLVSVRGKAHSLKWCLQGGPTRRVLHVKRLAKRSEFLYHDGTIVVVHPQ
jgi:hypothetical protein